MKEQDQKLLKALNDCTAACYHCLSSCLQEKEMENRIDCIRLDLDCAEICALSAAFISRSSDHAKHLLKECAEICAKCAEECGKHAEMDHCRECAEMCRICAQMCEAYQ